jgi:hypothetical protein
MHPNYYSGIPTYRYELGCGHSTHYQQPIPLGEFGYCQSCRKYFVHDGMVNREITPKDSRHRTIPDMTVAQRVDQAIMRSRVAELLEATDTADGELNQPTVEMVADVTQTSTITVWRVASDMGLTGKGSF